MTSVLVATQSNIIRFNPVRAAATLATGLGDRPTCLVADPLVPGRTWCGTHKGGVFRSDDWGTSWHAVGLDGRSIMSVAASPAQRDLVWVGMEPSAIWCSTDGGATWADKHGLDALPSSSEWSFPPKPHTHHVRWIASHPFDPARLWIAVEAGALVSTLDGGRTWRDRVDGGPWDTHELAVHPGAPNMLRVAAGDGYFESGDAGQTWRSPEDGLEVGYLRSVAIDPGNAEVVLVSASTGPRSAYVAGVSDGRIYRRVGHGSWERVTRGWPDRPSTIAPLLSAGLESGEFWAADERGVHRSDDGGSSWDFVGAYPTPPNHVRGLAVAR